jgi:hypothetical protein
MAGRKAAILSMTAILFILFSPEILQAGFPDLKFGLKLGGGLANIFGQDTYDQKWHSAFFSGIFLDIPLYRNFLFGSELNFFRKGSVYSLKSEGMEYSEQYFVDYLEIPVLLKFFFLKKNQPELYLYAGPSVGFNLKAKLKVSLDGLEESVEADNLTGTDFLLNAGAGTAFTLKTGLLILELRYSHGLKSICTDQESEIKNKSLIVLAGYRF